MSVSGRMAIRPLLLLFSPLFIRGIRFCFLPLLLPYPDNPAYPYKFVFTSRFGFPVSSALSVFYRFRFCFCFCFCFFGFRISVLGSRSLQIKNKSHRIPQSRNLRIRRFSGKFVDLHLPTLAAILRLDGPKTSGNMRIKPVTPVKIQR